MKAKVLLDMIPDYRVKETVILPKNQVPKNVFKDRGRIFYLYKGSVIEIIVEEELSVRIRKHKEIALLRRCNILEIGDFLHDNQIEWHQESKIWHEMELSDSYIANNSPRLIQKYQKYIWMLAEGLSAKLVREIVKDSTIIDNYYIFDSVEEYEEFILDKEGFKQFLKHHYSMMRKAKECREYIK